MAKYLVGIDAGHGMYTEGKQSVSMSEDLYIDGKLVREKGKVIKENEWNRGVSEYLAKALNRCGIDTMFTADMTGKKDTPLSTRANKANEAKCDILISNHYNAIGNCNKWQTKCKGLLVLRTKNCSSESIELGKVVVNQLVNDIDYEYSYGLMRDVDMSGFTLAILRQTNMPAILIEYGFMDYKKEAKLMLNTEHQEKCAESVCKAICKYFDVKYISPYEEVEDKIVYNCKAKIVCNDVLNVRAARPKDGVLADVKFTLPKDTVVQIGYSYDGRCSIYTDNDYGYVNKKYLVII